MAASAGYNAILGLCTAVLFFFVNGFKIGFSWYSLIAAMLYNGLIVSYTIIGFKLLKAGTIAMYTLSLMSGGMTVPYIYGLLFLDEPFSVLRTIALVLVLAGYDTLSEIATLCGYNDYKYFSVEFKKI